MNEKSSPIWHALENHEVFEKLHSSESGLTEEEAKKRLTLFGPNTIRLKPSEGIAKMIWRQFHNPIVYVLLFSTFLALALGKVTDSIVVFSTVVLNTLLGFFQEYRAHKTIQALTSLIPNKSTVLRDGTTKSIPSSEIVPGDVVELEPGDRISADLRLFSIKNLQCDESTLTGESLPVNKRTEAISVDAIISDKKCMAFNGTYVTAGKGFGVVTATGIDTEFGKISVLIEQVSFLETPIAATIKKIAKWITFGILLVSFCLFFIGYLRGSQPFDAAFAAVTLAVAAIPEGLPAIITIACSIGVRRMARKQAIIRQLPAVEILGSTDIICTDKTGTLTCNEMTVQKLWTQSGPSFVSGVGYVLEGHFFPETHNHEELVELLKAAILCSDASLNQSSKGLVPIGDPTEIALVICGRKLGIQEKLLREEWKRKDVIPFDSEKKLMATLNDRHKKKYIFIKGAPEQILSICNQTIDISEIQKQIEFMAKDGMRILAVAKKEVSESVSEIDETIIQNGCTLLGLIGMIDPPRKEAYLALKSCREAGICVKMITGDHPLTAEVISRELGILREGKVVTGLELSKFDEKGWKEAAIRSHVFARVSPEHKLKLVKVLQRLGHIVAMTGDGVNDAAALKQADIGIAMGIKGTAVAKEASDMILADDNFASIEAAVEEGRRVYDNLIKSLAFVLPTSLGQALVILFAILFSPIREGLVLYPMSPVQILWVNLVVAVSLSMPLAFESAEPDIMKRPPRKKNAPILSRFLLMKTLTVSIIMAIGTIGLFAWEYHDQIARQKPENIALSEAQTMAVTTIMLFQVFYLFNCRSLRYSAIKTSFFSNRTIFVGVGIVLFAQMAFIYLPFMNDLFKSSSLTLEAWIASLLIAFLMLPFLYILSWVSKRGLGNSKN